MESRGCTGSIATVIATLLFLVLVPIDAQSFFCNQKQVSVSWGKDAPFKIDGNGFSRGNFQVVNAGDPEIVQFDKMELADALEAEFQITGLKPGTTTISVSWEFTDKSDNGLCTATVEVEDMPYPFASALNDFKAYAERLDLDPDRALGLMVDHPLCPGSTIRSAYDNSYELSVDKNIWFAYLDNGKEGRFGHPGTYLIIDAETGALTTEGNEWPPTVDGTTYSYDDVLPEGGGAHVFYGGYNEPTPEPNGSVISEEVTSTVPKEEVCAVLVSGTATNPRQIEAFEQDVDFIKGNLMRESYGPQLTEGDITVLNNGSFADIKSTLESFRGRYRKVYFFYSGHGTEKYMVTNDTVGNRMWYTDLADALVKSEADEICVVIDACHSGGAIETFKEKNGLASRNVTLLTSCRVDTTSWTRYIVTGGGDTVRTGEYTWAFSKCFGDPRADGDGDGKTSLVETHQWALSQNPTLDVGGTLRGRMDPQIWVHRAAPVAERVIRPADTRMTIDQGENERFPVGSELRMDLHLDRNDTTTSDPEVYTISPTLQWEISLEPKLSVGYRIGMQIDYSYTKDRFTGEGEPGLVWRSDSTSEWERYGPTVPKLEDDSLLVFDVTTLGEFALAEVRPRDQSVASDAEREGYRFVGASPNPMSDRTEINYTLPRRSSVELRVVDLQGETLYRSDVGMQEGGDRTLEWDGRRTNGEPVPSGTYFIELALRQSTTDPIRLVRQVVVVR